MKKMMIVLAILSGWSCFAYHLYLQHQRTDLVELRAEQTYQLGVADCRATYGAQATHMNAIALTVVAAHNGEKNKD